MANDTCPHCGAGRTNDDKYVAWTCGSLQWGDRVRMSDHCETRQDLAEVTAERDELRREVSIADSHARDIEGLFVAMKGQYEKAAADRDELRRRIDEAQAVWVKLPDDDWDAEIHLSLEEAVDVWGNLEANGVARVRLVRDDTDPQEAVQ